MSKSKELEDAIGTKVGLEKAMASATHYPDAQSMEGALAELFASMAARAAKNADGSVAIGSHIVVSPNPDKTPGATPYRKMVCYYDYAGQQCVCYKDYKD